MPNLEHAFDQFEYVTVVFGAANTDTIVPFSSLRPANPDQIRWIDITPNSVYTGGVDYPATIYRSTAPGRLPFSSSYIVLRATVANYTTRLLLFLERSA